MDSFQLVKEDVQRLQKAVIGTNQKYEDLIETIDLLRKNQDLLYKKLTQVDKKKPVKKVVTKVVTKTKRQMTHFLAAKTGVKFHDRHCPFAQNIKPKHKITFKSKVKALNEGYKPCKCVK